ncbi:MAG: hypothetical protein ACE5HE_06490 [Phycisphaerae bacterium]
MEARERSVLTSALGVCLAIVASSIIPACDSVSGITDDPMGYRLSPGASTIPDALAHRFIDIYEDDDLKIGALDE